MKTVAIISQKGGAGKTTVAIHLAVAAEQHGLRAAVFDLDPQASATSWADRRKTLSLPSSRRSRRAWPICWRRLPPNLPTWCSLTVRRMRTRPR